MPEDEDDEDEGSPEAASAIPCTLPAPLSRSCSRRGSCSGYAVLRGEKAPDDALARELGAMGLL